MPKRRLENDDNFDYFRKKLKKLESELKESRKRRSRVIESSSSSSSPTSSREPSPSRQDLSDGDIRSVPSTEDLPEGQDAISSLLSEDVPAAPDVPAAQDASPPEDALDTVVLDILGDDPTATIEYGPDIHKDVASRFEHIATHGLDPTQRKEILGKYKIPTNCTLIAAPILNAEIKAALPEPMVKRDKSFELRQTQIAAAISCLASAVTDELSSAQINQDLLKKLMDTGRLLCDIQSTDSKSRRNFAMFSVKKDMKEHLSSTKIDKHLFGENLSDTLKSAKAVNKSGTDLKVQQKTFKKAFVPHNSKAPPASKNWKPGQARRQPGPPPRSREPAYPRTQHAPSSRRSSPPPRTTRRR